MNNLLIERNLALRTHDNQELFYHQQNAVKPEIQPVIQFVFIKQFENVHTFPVYSLEVSSTDSELDRWFTRLERFYEICEDDGESIGMDARRGLAHLLIAFHETKEKAWSIPDFSPGRDEGVWVYFYVPGKKYSVYIPNGNLMESYYYSSNGETSGNQALQYANDEFVLAKIIDKDIEQNDVPAE